MLSPSRRGLKQSRARERSISNTPTMLSPSRRGLKHRSGTLAGEDGNLYNAVPIAKGTETA